MFVPADVLLRKAGIVRRRGRSGHMLAADMRGGSQPAIAWLQLNSNCGDHSGRTKAVQAIMDLGLVPVHAFGPCLRNQNVTERIASKSDLFRNYKFCVAMENSIEGAAGRHRRPLFASWATCSVRQQASVACDLEAHHDHVLPLWMHRSVTHNTKVCCWMLSCARCARSGLRDGEDI